MSTLDGKEQKNVLMRTTFSCFLISPSTYKFWIVLAILIKGVFFIYFLQRGGNLDLFWGSYSGDAESYISPIESLLNGGSYSPDHRMPGIGFLYFIFRIFGNTSFALNGVIITQMILSSVSVYYLSLLSIRIFKIKWMFYATFFFYAISTFVTEWDTRIMTESLATSMLIIGLYFYFEGIKKNSEKIFVVVGLLFTWLIFLKPVLTPVLIILIIALIFEKRKKGQKWIKLVLCFLLPFFLIDGAWTIRNYYRYDKIIPLQSSVYYPSTISSYRVHLFNYIQSWGGSIVWWDPKAEICLFNFIPHETEFLKQESYSGRNFPKRSLNTYITEDSLRILKKEISISLCDTITESSREFYNELLSAKLQRFTSSIKTETPFLYYIGSRGILFVKLFNTSGTERLFTQPFSQLTFPEKLIKIIMSGFTVFVLLCGLLGLLLSLILFWKNKNYAQFLLSIITSYGVLIISFLKLSEARYITPMYPFLLLFATFLLLTWYKSQNEKIYLKKLKQPKKLL